MAAPLSNEQTLALIEYDLRRAGIAPSEVLEHSVNLEPYTIMLAVIQRDEQGAALRQWDSGPVVKIMAIPRLSRIVEEGDYVSVGRSSLTWLVLESPTLTATVMQEPLVYLESGQSGRKTLIHMDRLTIRKKGKE